MNSKRFNNGRKVWKTLTGYGIGLRKKHGLPYKHLFKYAR